MKEMIYQSMRTFEILAHGEHNGFPYWVISMGTHPCAYVDVTSIKDKLGENPRIGCHGGVTYDDDHLRGVWDEASDGFESGTRRFIGWDYAHLNDYYEHPGEMTSAFINMMEKSHKWTTEEMVEEAKWTIDGIIEIM